MQVGAGAATYVCHGDALTWHELTADTQAQPNAGYVASGASDLTLTLPATDDLRIGDVVRLINNGTGSVSVELNAEQTFRYGPGVLATPTSFATRGPGAPWQSVASSADGSKLVAAHRGGHLYISTDSGLTWTPRESSRSWGLVASSADGSKLVAAPVSGPLYVTGTGSLVARPASLVELTYTGNAQFFVSNVQGTVEAP